MPPETPHPLETLLAHRSWVRAVARRLVRDPASADDLEQDAWVAAMRRPPDVSRDPKPWLRRVLKNAASNQQRAAGRRARREAAAHRDRVVRSPDAILAETEQHQRVVQAVLALDEPYRTTLVLRFYEGLSPSEIASEQRVAIGTVHSRLHRAIERLRADLDRQEQGDRRAWMAALLPLAGGRDAAAQAGAAAASIASAGGIALTLSKSKLLVVAAAMLLIGVGVFIKHLDHRAAEDADADPAFLRTEAEPSLQGRAPAVATAPATPREAAPVVTTTAESAGRTVSGRVVDPSGGPVVGAEVFALPRVARGLDEERLREARFGRARTDESGAFQTRLGEIRDPVLVAFHEGYLSARARLTASSEPVVLTLGAPRRLRVRVLDPDGRWPADTSVVARTANDETEDRAVDPRHQSAWVGHEQDVRTEREVELRIGSLAPLEVDCRPPFGFAAVPPAVTIGPEVEQVTFRLIPSARIHVRARAAPGTPPLPERARVEAYVYRHDSDEVVSSASRLSPAIDFVRALGPGRYRIEVGSAGRARWIREVEIEREGQRLELDAPLGLPLPGKELAQVLLRPRIVGDVPEPVRALAARVTGKWRSVGWIALVRRTGASRWHECFASGTEDGGVELEGTSIGRVESGLESATYDFVLAQRGTGRAGVVKGVRILSGQVNEIEVTLAPGSFVQLPRVIDPDHAYDSITFSTEMAGALPAYAFPTPGSTVTYAGPDATKHLLRVPLTPTLLGPFPGAAVTVTTQPTGERTVVEGASLPIR